MLSASTYGHFSSAEEFRSQCHIFRSESTVAATPFDETDGDEAASTAKVSYAQRRRRSDQASRKLVTADDDDEVDSAISSPIQLLAQDLNGFSERPILEFLF